MFVRSGGGEACISLVPRRAMIMHRHPKDSSVRLRLTVGLSFKKKRLLPKRFESVYFFKRGVPTVPSIGEFLVLAHGLDEKNMSRTRWVGSGFQGLQVSTDYIVGMIINNMYGLNCCRIECANSSNKRKSCAPK